MKLKQLKRRSVINVHNGNFIGYISDISIELEDGKIGALIVKLPFFKRIKFTTESKKSIISWDKLVSIGKDVILVNIIDN